jgi:hypothetical protein
MRFPRLAPLSYHASLALLVALAVLSSVPGLVVHLTLLDLFEPAGTAVRPASRDEEKPRSAGERGRSFEGSPERPWRTAS